MILHYTKTPSFSLFSILPFSFPFSFQIFLLHPIFIYLSSNVTLNANILFSFSNFTRAPLPISLINLWIFLSPVSPSFIAFTCGFFHPLPPFLSILLKIFREKWLHYDRFQIDQKLSDRLMDLLSDCLLSD